MSRRPFHGSRRSLTPFATALPMAFPHQLAAAHASKPLLVAAPAVSLGVGLGLVLAVLIIAGAVVAMVVFNPRLRRLDPSAPPAYRTPAENPWLGQWPRSEPATKPPSGTEAPAAGSGQAQATTTESAPPVAAYPSMRPPMQAPAPPSAMPEAKREEQPAPVASEASEAPVAPPAPGAASPAAPPVAVGRVSGEGGAGMAPPGQALDGSRAGEKDDETAPDAAPQPAGDIPPRAQGQLELSPDASRDDDLRKRKEEADASLLPADPAGEPIAAPPPPPDGASHSEPVQFTALYPKEVPVQTWNTLLVYAHLASALPALQADALKFKDELGGAPRASHAQAGQSIAQGTELTLVPSCEGGTFNPERVSFRWVEDLHRAEFRFWVEQGLAGSAGNGEIAVYAGPLIVASLKIAMLFDEPGLPPPAHQDVEITANLYKQIFISYSRRDTAVVAACRNAYKALGITVNMDVDSLRPGEVFDDTLMRLIDTSDVFQLFWSERSAASDYVRQEWEYALDRNKGPGFIRPVYWEQPLPPPPPELARLHFAYVKLPELAAPPDANA